MIQTYVINMLSGPGSGKSTLAAELYVTLKKAGYNVEYLQEYAKKLVWLKRYAILNDQYFVSKKYYESIKAMAGHVNFVILDSSLLNGLWYNRNNQHNVSNIQKTEDYVMNCFLEFNNIMLFIQRGAYRYENEGRIQTEDESIQIDQEIKYIVEEKGQTYTVINLGKEDYIEQIMEILKTMSSE